LAQIDRFENIFTVPTDKLKEITAHFVKELEKGLTPDGGDIVCCTHQQFSLLTE